MDQKQILEQIYEEGNPLIWKTFQILAENNIKVDDKGEAAVKEAEKEVLQHWENIFRDDYKKLKLFVLEDTYNYHIDIDEIHLLFPENKILDTLDAISIMNHEIHQIIDALFSNYSAEEFQAMIDKIPKKKNLLLVEKMKYIFLEKGDCLNKAKERIIKDKSSSDYLLNLYEDEKNTIFIELYKNKDEIKNAYLSLMEIQVIDILLKIIAKMNEVDRNIEILLINYSDEEFQNTIDEIVKEDNRKIKNILIKYRYFTEYNFNMEMIFLLLLYQKNLDLYEDNEFSILKTVIKKHDFLFMNIYKELLNKFPRLNKMLGIEIEVTKEITDAFYYRENEYHGKIDKRLIYMRLKKIIYLYIDYYNLISEENVLLRKLNDFSEILSETKLPDYDCKNQNNLVTYITKKLQINDTKLAKLLDVSNARISQWKSDGIPDKYEYVLKKIISCSNTFWKGETTIVNYGKFDATSDKYLFPPSIIVSAYAEIILELIVKFHEYENNLDKSEHSQRKISFGNTYQNDISKDRKSVV